MREPTPVDTSTEARGSARRQPTTSSGSRERSACSFLLLLQLLTERGSYGNEVVQRLHEIGLNDIVEGVFLLLIVVPPSPSTCRAVTPASDCPLEAPGDGLRTGPR
jgi:hypothetical protein